MRLSKELLATFLFTAVIVAVAAPPEKSALDKPTLEAYLRHLFVWGPQIQVKIADPVVSELPGFLSVIAFASAGKAELTHQLYVSKDGRKIVQGAVYDISRNPFERQIAKVKTDSLPRLGNADAPVTILEVSDFQCPFCKEEAKMLRDNLVSTYPTQVKLYFQEYPLESIHPWAKAAAIAGRCIFKQNADAFWQYHDWIFERQQEITPENFKPKVMEFAKGKPIDALQLGRCLDSRETEPEVERSIANARELQVTSTPTLFVNGRMLSGRMNWPQLRGLLDFELEHLKRAAAATGCEVSDTGCEVKLPAPFSK